MSASAPTDRLPNSGRFIQLAAADVDISTTWFSVRPRFINLDIVVGMVARDRKKLPWCTSVEIVFGMWPCGMSLPAVLNQKLNPPCPTSN